MDHKQALESTGEAWSPAWQKVLEFDPAYLTAYINLRLVPATEQKLPRKVQELILLAMDLQCTRMYYPGIAAHTSAAFEAGATVEEIIETIELCSVLSVHSMIVGVPLLVEVLEERGEALPESLDAHQQRMKTAFQTKRGYWSEKWEPILRLSPKFFEAYTEYSSVSFEENHSVMDLKVKELIYCAIDCVTTHMFEPGLRIHIGKALQYGATPGEIMEVFELAVLMGSQSVLAGVEALQGQLQKQKQKQK